MGILPGEEEFQVASKVVCLPTELGQEVAAGREGWTARLARGGAVGEEEGLAQGAGPQTEEVGKGAENHSECGERIIGFIFIYTV